MEEKLIWHYTSREHGDEIISDGVIKVSYVEKKFKLKPAVWFSLQQFWEPTACKVHRFTDSQDAQWMSGEEGMMTQNELCGIYRFGIRFNPANLTIWAKYKYVSKISIDNYYRMEKLGKDKGGHPSDWFAVFLNVPRYQWVKVEVFDGREWVPMEY